MIDRIAVRFTLMIFAVLAMSQGCARLAHAERSDGFVEGDYCDEDDRANSWTHAQKQRTRERIWAACKRVGGSDLYCKFWDAAVVRESSGVASRVHVLGQDSDGRSEYGLGPLGLSVRWHSDKWPGSDVDPAFCTPEAAFIVGHAIARRAVTVWGATTAVEIQAIYGGGAGRHCMATGVPAWVFTFPGLAWISEVLNLPRESQVCRVIPLPRHRASVCDRMGSDCTRPISIKDLGRAVPKSERRAWVLGFVG